MALTSRTWLIPLRRAIAERRPDLIKAWGGGCNALLVRGEIRDHRIAELTKLPERRVAHGVQLGDGSWVVNLHATTEPKARTRADCAIALGAALEWAAGAPLVFGGDFNLRPERSAIFAELEARFALRPPTAPSAIDHLLARDLDVLGAPRALPPQKREVPFGGHVLRLSDHAPVTARFRIRSPVD
jgi:endonuclease/exonuclease/phosphatase family metal-dependent hydrolase